ncbi:MAG: hypothetical protein ABW133_21035 [Polyangiaceae bacterium]
MIRDDVWVVLGETARTAAIYPQKTGMIMTQRNLTSRFSILFGAACLALGGVFAGCVVEAEPEVPGIDQTSPEAVRVGAGAACGAVAGAARCSAGLVCMGVIGERGTCRAIAREGQRCGGWNRPLCASGLVCVGEIGEEGACHRRGAMGDACGEGDAPCAVGLYCDKTESAATCRR